MLRLPAEQEKRRRRNHLMRVDILQHRTARTRARSAARLR